MRDLRYAFRMLRRDPGFAVIAILALALGIGANTAIFSVVNAALLRPLPYPDGARLMVVWDRLSKLGIAEFPVSYANYLDYKAGNRVFENVAAFSAAEFNLTTADSAERVPGVRVSANLFAMLGAAAVVGRVFLPQENEAGRDAVVVVSDSLWRRRFGGDPNVLGKTMILDGSPLQIVGILPRAFSFAPVNPPPQVWIPLQPPPDSSRTAGALELIARLKPGVTVEQAIADMSAVARGVEERYHPYRGPHGEDAGYGVSVTSLRDQLYGGMRRGLLVLLAAVAFVLLIACANVANLLLVRTAGRRREIAVRRALGAGRLGLARQLLVESVTLALAGGALGLLLAFWGVSVLAALMPAGLPQLETIPLDSRVLTFTILVSLVAGLVFGVAPLVEGSGLHLTEALKEGRGMSGGTRSGRLRHALITAEIALSLVLVIGAGLLLKSFVRLTSVNPGFRAEKLITARISLPENQYRDNDLVTAFFRDLVPRTRAVPGVQSASVVSRLPLTGGPGGDPFSIEGRPYDASGSTPQVAHQQVVGADYFHTMQIPLLAGRVFAERESQPVAVINRTLARGFWPSAPSDAIGRRIVLGAPRPGADWLTIVGIVGDVRNSTLDAQPLPQMYVPIEQAPARSMALVIRTAGDPDNVIAAVRAQIFMFVPSLPLYDVKTMAERESATVAQPRFQTLLLGLFAALALSLAAIGIYGVIAHSVAQRTHEIGIRMALGARAASVLKLVLREGLIVGLAGIVVGLAATLALVRLLSGLLYDVPPFDPATFLGASLLLMAVVLAACYIPACRASRLDPIIALRWE
ncbi:MAG TPA: ABC transporter permease [Bryobacteraceae bacterium]|nr:ABC transporter permease [Bryobacteraceae bacterium]